MIIEKVNCSTTSIMYSWQISYSICDLFCLLRHSYNAPKITENNCYESKLKSRTQLFSVYKFQRNKWKKLSSFNLFPNDSQSNSKSYSKSYWKFCYDATPRNSSDSDESSYFCMHAKHGRLWKLHFWLL
jgi:hypothetical protein